MLINVEHASIKVNKVRTQNLGFIKLVEIDDTANRKKCENLRGKQGLIQAWDYDRLTG